MFYHKTLRIPHTGVDRLGSKSSLIVLQHFPQKNLKSREIQRTGYEHLYLNSLILSYLCFMFLYTPHACIGLC